MGWTASWLLRLAFTMVTITEALPVRAEPCALPAENQLGPLDPQPEPSWTLQEKWIWKRILAGELADLNKLYCEQLDPRGRDEAWQTPAKPRQVSERFLLDVLVKKRFAEAVSPRGLRIIGALFLGPVDMSGVEFEREIWLDKSRFTGPVSLNSAKLKGHVSFEGSTFEAGLDMGSLTVEQSMFLSGGAAFKGDVVLHGAKVGGSFDASGSTFGATLNMNNLAVEGDLFLRGGGRPSRASL